jgi:hypothetical protein
MSKHASNALVIPPKREIIPPGFAASIRADLVTITDIDAVDEGRRRIAALRAYATKKEHKQECEAAERWCELRIGELLGPGKPGPQKKSPIAIGDLPPRGDRDQFRQLAKHKKVVAPLIESGVTRRAKLLKKIKQVERAAKRSPPSPNGDDAPDIRCGDCLIELPKVAAGSVRLAFADPPYNIGIDYGEGKKADALPLWEYLAWCARWMAECHRVLSGDGSLWVLINHEHAATPRPSSRAIPAARSTTRRRARTAATENQVAKVAT